MDLLADALQALRKTDGDHGLAFAGSGGRGRGDHDQFAANGKRRVVEQIEFELRSVGADRFVFRRQKGEFPGDLFDGKEHMCVQNSVFSIGPLRPSSNILRMPEGHACDAGYIESDGRD